VEAEVEEFKCFSEEFQKGVEQWKNCVFRAELSSEKIRDHFLHDPCRIAVSKAETQVRTIQSDEGSAYLSSIYKFLSTLDRKAISLEKFEKKQSGMRAKLEELSRASAENRRISISASLAKKRQSSIESGLEISQRDQNNYIEDIKKLTQSFLSNVTDARDREMMCTVLKKRLGFNSFRVLEGIELGVHLENNLEYMDAPPNYAEEKDDVLIEERRQPDAPPEFDENDQKLLDRHQEEKKSDPFKVLNDVIDDEQKSVVHFSQKEKDNGEEDEEDSAVYFKPLPRSPLKPKSRVDGIKPSNSPPSSRRISQNLIVDKQSKEAESENLVENALRSCEKKIDEDNKMDGENEECIIPAYMDNQEKESDHLARSLGEKSMPELASENLNLPVYFAHDLVEDKQILPPSIQMSFEQKEFKSDEPDGIPSKIIGSDVSLEKSVFLSKLVGSEEYKENLGKDVEAVSENKIMEFDSSILKSCIPDEDDHFLNEPKFEIALSPNFHLHVDSPVHCDQRISHISSESKSEKDEIDSEVGENEEIPDDLLDPLTNELMKDPVVLLSDGITYDRSSILQWLEFNDVSPVTKEILDSKEIAPDRAKRRLIEEYMFKASGAW
jgi:hypothetical protein